MSDGFHDGLIRTSGAKFKPDDGCDYTDVIIHRLQARSRASCGAPYIPEPKPRKIKMPIIAPRKKLKIGARRSYSYNVMLAIHQLSCMGTNEKVIAKELSIPVNNIRQILAHETRTSHKAWILARQSPLPTESEILFRLAIES